MYDDRDSGSRSRCSHQFFGPSGVPDLFRSLLLATLAERWVSPVPYVRFCPLPGFPFLSFFFLTAARLWFVPFESNVRVRSSRLASISIFSVNAFFSRPFLFPSIPSLLFPSPSFRPFPSSPPSLFIFLLRMRPFILSPHVTPAIFGPLSPATFLYFEI